MRLLDTEAEYSDDAVHRLVLLPHSAAAVRLVVPEARAGGVQSCTVFLHDNAAHCKRDRRRYAQLLDSQAFKTQGRRLQRASPGAYSPMYLKGFCRPVNFFITPSITSEVHCGTFSCSYVACCARARR